MLSVFITYRKADTKHATARIKDWLARVLHSYKFFLDVEGLMAGAEWRQELKRQLASMDVLLVVIGPNWLGPRLFEFDDIVRFEIEEAIAQKALIIPVLVDGAEPPPRQLLPESIGEIAELQAHRISDDTEESFRDSIVRLAEIIRRDGRPLPANSATLVLRRQKLHNSWVHCAIFVDDRYFTDFLKDPLPDSLPVYTLTKPGAVVELLVPPGFHVIRVDMSYRSSGYRTGTVSWSQESKPLNLTVRPRDELHLLYGERFLPSLIGSTLGGGYRPIRSAFVEIDKKKHPK